MIVTRLAYMRSDDFIQLDLPDDFQSALALNETASANFANLPDGSKRRLVGFIGEADGAVARMGRIDDAVRKLAEGNIQ